MKAPLTRCPIFSNSSGGVEPSSARVFFSTGLPVVMVPVEQLQRIPGLAAGLVRHGPGEILWGEPDRAKPLLPSLGQ